MTAVFVDVSDVVLPDIARELNRAGVHIVGSDKSETPYSVRLLVEGKDIPADLDGDLVRITVHSSREGLSYSYRFEFERVSVVSENSEALPK